MPYRPLRWRFGAKRFGPSSVAFMVDGQDLVHISEIDRDGNAFVIVYASSHPDAEVLFTGHINVAARPTDTGTG
jgi:flagellar basal body rod protein FlgC